MNHVSKRVETSYVCGLFSKVLEQSRRNITYPDGCVQWNPVYEWNDLRLKVGYNPESLDRQGQLSNKWATGAHTPK